MQPTPTRSFWSFCLLGSLLASAAWAAEPVTPPYTFQRDILPILSKNCFACHGPDEEHREAGLRLDTELGAHLKLESGSSALLPGRPDDSELIARVTAEDETLRMPPPKHGPPLTPQQAALLKAWIADGGNYSQHWSFVPPAAPQLPAVQRTDWSRNPIDRFILAQIEQAGLAPSPEADRHTLIRRLSLDLRGLPPSPDEVAQFLNDSSPRAYEDLVDRFLQDPAFGERFGRMWLDLARYADSRGFGSDPLRPHIWRYRDWVINAFNQNLPYDRFTIEQIAGDLLPNPTLDQQIATAFHRNTMTNTEGGTDDEEFRIAAVKDRAEVTLQVWMGLTLGCAQCHNHKYDPLSQKDYYQMTAFFNQSADFDQPDERPTLPAPTPEMRALNAKIDADIALLREQLNQPTPELAAAQTEWEDSLKIPDSWTPLAVSGAASSDTLPLAPQNATPIYALRWHNAPPTASLQLRYAIPQPIPPVKARFVRIELPGKEKILSLAEVQIMNGETNLAPAGKATQSSTSIDAPAARAIDGNTAGEFAQASVTHTNTEDNPWWELDLGSEQIITDLRIWNRLDGVSDRLNNFKLQILDSNRTPRWTRTHIPAPTPTLAQSVRHDLVDPISLSPAVAGLPAADRLFLFSQPIDPTLGPVSLQVTFPAGTTPPDLASLQFTTTDSPRYTARLPIDESTLQLIDTPADQRTPDQSAALAAHFRSFTPLLNTLREQIATLEKSRPSYPLLPVMQELPPDRQRKSHIMVKGNFLNLGEEVGPLLPTSFTPAAELKPGNRLDLARWLVSPHNPLTARVAVNRFWAQIFSRGLVETEEDFGTQGESPTHPELLDWLALEFLHPDPAAAQHPWDVKHLLRLLVTSATYRQSSHITPQQLERDSRNRYYSRAPRYRLEAELIRDQALTLSGLLARKLGGPSVFPHQPEGLWQAAFNGERTWQTSPGDDRYRRGLYVFWRRTVPYPSMAAFDAPSREICTIRRSRTNTPLQAFVTLNDPVYVEASQALARRILNSAATTEQRARFALELVLVRPPTDAETLAVISLVADELDHYRTKPEEALKLSTQPLGPLPPDADPLEAAAWTVAANVLLNLDAVLTRN